MTPITLDKITNKTKQQNLSDNKIHPWRICPLGKYYVKEHLVPANICAGVRWLFRKKITANSKLDRESTWIEAVAEYKGVLNQNPPSVVMERFLHHYSCIVDG